MFNDTTSYPDLLDSMNAQIMLLNSIILFQKEEITKSEISILQLDDCLVRQNDALDKFKIEKERLEIQRDESQPLLNYIEEDDQRISKETIQINSNNLSFNKCQDISLKRKRKKKKKSLKNATTNLKAMNIDICNVLEDKSTESMECVVNVPSCSSFDEGDNSRVVGNNAIVPNNSCDLKEKSRDIFKQWMKQQWTFSQCIEMRDSFLGMVGLNEAENKLIRQLIEKADKRMERYNSYLRAVEKKSTKGSINIIVQDFIGVRTTVKVELNMNSSMLSNRIRDTLVIKEPFVMKLRGRRFRDEGTLIFNKVRDGDMITLRKIIK